MPTATMPEALKLCQSLSRLTLSAIIDKVVVQQSLSKAGNDKSRGRVYDVSLAFLPKDDLKRKHKVSQDQIAFAVESVFLRKLLSLIAQRLKISRNATDGLFSGCLFLLAWCRLIFWFVFTEVGVGVSVSKFHEVMSSNNDDDEGAEKPARKAEEEDKEGEDGDATTEKEAKRKKQSASYDDDGGADKDDSDSDSDNDDKGENQEKEEDKDSSDSDDEKESADNDVEEMEVDESPSKAGPSSTPGKGADKDKAKDKKKPVLTETPKKGSPYERLSGFHFDKETNTCHFSLKYSVNLTKLLMVGEIEKAANTTVLREVKGITRCFVEKNEKPEETMV